MARPEAAPAKNASNGSIVNYGETIYNCEPWRLPGSAGFQPAKVGAGSCRADSPMARPEAAPLKRQHRSIVNYGETLCYREPLESCHCRFVKFANL